MRHARGWSVLALGVAIAIAAAAVLLSRSTPRRAVDESTASPSLTAADSLQRAGRALENRGDWAGARTCYESALAMRRALLGRRHVDVATSLEDVGIAYTQLAIFDSARVCLEEALIQRQQLLGPDHLDVAQTQNSLGQFYFEVGDYALARRAYEEALRIRQEVRGPDHAEVAGVLNNFATLLKHMGEDREAQAMLERALAIRTRVHGSRHRLVASTLANLAIIHRDRGEMDSARNYYRQALEIVERTLPPEHPLVASYLFGYGRLALDSGDEATAATLLERAAATRERVLGKGDPATAEVWADLALLHERSGDLPAARARLDSALVVMQRALPVDHPDLSETCVQHARVLNRCGDPVGAFESALEGERGARAHLQLTAQSLAERQALQYDAIRASGLDVAIAIATRPDANVDVARVWDALVRSRALVLDELASRQRIVAAAASDPRVAVAATALRDARARVAALKVRSGSDRLHAQTILAAAQQDCDAAERRLADRSAPLRGDLKRDRIGFEAVRSRLGASTTLLAYVVYGAALEQPGFASRVGAHQDRGEAAYAAFILRSDGSPPRVLRLGSAATIDPLAVEWVQAIRRGGAALDRQSLDAAESKAREIGMRLRALIWDPMAAELANEERIVIVPDGVLSLINFYAMPQPDGGYLIERDVIVHEFAAERDLVTGRDPAPEGRGLLALGGPRFDAKPATTTAQATLWRAPRGATRDAWSDCQDLTGVHFEPLPASAREAEEVASLWRQNALLRGNVLCLIGDAASETAFATAAPGYRVLHLATHGFFLDGECAEELPETRGMGRVVRKEPARSPLRPMLGLAGLALAGANARDTASGPENDGILTAEEIASLDLRGVEVAVLSACDTGRGEIRAREGVLGLRRAFTVAGAQTMVLGLWPVRDDLAREWMHNFHTRYLTEGVRPEVAARDAGRAVLQARRSRGEGGHPFAWAGFIATGGVPDVR